ncbi:hypothetical protein BURPS1710b_1325 [Burkholderia pseudomallei 1710b]|uniref:Uncharacterized protein n=1 Tax=Burkholderia pseudomallei (strain 1710b) TaxID=320372 RepID=Q3JUL8_BURP1|nr:hypothetical protein BURPS1710b_1325 [Burkholderia pseudomallei 1710b]
MRRPAAARAFGIGSGFGPKMEGPATRAQRVAPHRPAPRRAVVLTEPARRASLSTRHDYRTRPAQAVHDRRRRHGRLPATRAIQAAGCDDESVADPEGRPEGRVSADPRENGPRPCGRIGRLHHRSPADRIRHRDPEADPGPRIDRGRRAPVVRHAALDRQGPRNHQALRSSRRRPRARADQARVDVGRHPRGRGAAARRHPLQHDAAVLARAGRRMRGSGRATDLAVRRPDLRLVQEAERRRLGRGAGRRRERSGRAVGAPHLHVLQALRLPDRSDGRELPHDEPDHRARRLRPADDQPRAAAEASRQHRGGRAQAVSGRSEGCEARARRDRRIVVPLPAERRRDGDRKARRRHSPLLGGCGEAREDDRGAALTRGLAACLRLAASRIASVHSALRDRLLFLEAGFGGRHVSRSVARAARRCRVPSPLAAPLRLPTLPPCIASGVRSRTRSVPAHFGLDRYTASHDPRHCHSNALQSFARARPRPIPALESRRRRCKYNRICFSAAVATRR